MEKDKLKERLIKDYVYSMREAWRDIYPERNIGKAEEAKKILEDFLNVVVSYEPDSEGVTRFYCWNKTEIIV